MFHQDLVSPPEGLLINIIQIQRKIISTFLLHVIPQVSPVGGLHYNGELHPIPTPQDGLAVSIDDVIKYLLWTLTLLKKEKLVFISLMKEKTRFTFTFTLPLNKRVKSFYQTMKKR